MPSVTSLLEVGGFSAKGFKIVALAIWGFWLPFLASGLALEYGPDESSSGDQWVEGFGDFSERLADATKFLDRAPWHGWGTLYRDPENPYIQRVDFGGRLHWQMARVDGSDAQGEQFSDTYTELRRLWVRSRLDFLGYFAVGGNVIFGSDERPRGRDINFAYRQFFDLWVDVDLSKVFDLTDVDEFRFRYGRIKHNMTHSGRKTVNHIQTVERAALANKLFFPFVPMSASLHLRRGEWSLQGSLYSTDNGGAPLGGVTRSEWGNWGDGLATYFWLQRDLSKQVDLDFLSLQLEGVYSFAGQGDDSWLYHRWASTSSVYLEQGRWSLLVEGAIGKNADRAMGQVNPDRQGLFYGGIIQPTYWLIEKRLQGVVQLQWMEGERAEGIKIDTRYIGLDPETSSGNRAVVNNGFGAVHKSVYLGLNYFMPSEKSKFMAGIEWEELRVPGDPVNATTMWFAYRAYF